MRNITYLLGILLLAFLLSDCSRCSRSGSVRAHNSDSRSNFKQRVNSTVSSGSETVKMLKRGGVYEVPARINGVEMEFIFDTGASDVTISLTEALYLFKQGKLNEDDFIGVAQYQIADGSIAEGTVINLREVQVGNKKVRNVQASIVHNMEAPLLLGQSALERFGNFSIDYKRSTLTFK
ncbi:retropepsin-like aspartic protease family protein [Myroides marinus]|uniref:retropepsin-like aspartic protease family protein n=1 Tax=Myroides marinus TaxID=703342 RepID=UPI002578DAEF|nr:retropepsin-like aspartic protease [Myroides marinus]MDM1376342.1 retroviral-like aspartic protease family protein [Myroides marinus]MDM1382064.1 retroviral-like aspartic protease family protein [Myroides marinus]